MTWQNMTIVWGLEVDRFYRFRMVPSFWRGTSLGREHFLSIGQEYLRRLGSAKTYYEAV